MKLNTKYRIRKIGNQYMIVDGSENISMVRVISLNETAGFVWKQAEILGDFSTEELAAKVCDRYDVSIETALVDVQQTMNQWLELGIVIS